MSGTLNINASVIAGGSSSVSGVIGRNGVGLLSAPSYTGVYGVSYGANGNGVSGEANSGSLAFGIYGKSSSGYAGFFDGKVQVNGNATGDGRELRWERRRTDKPEFRWEWRRINKPERMVANRQLLHRHGLPCEQHGTFVC